MRCLFALVCISWLAAASAAPSIRIERGDWGGASGADIEAVLRSVAEVMLPDLPQHADVRIVVRPSNSGPRVLAAKSQAGEHQVLLNVRDTRWDQLAYQFSHELCHIASNYDRRVMDDARDHRWFEEAVCEAVSIVALQRLAVHWQRAAPRPAWTPYAPAFAAYAQRVLVAEYQPRFSRNDERVAVQLLQLFQANGLQTIAYLNSEPRPGGGLDAYLAAWHDCCPQAHRALVGRVIELFRT